MVARRRLVVSDCSWIKIGNCSVTARIHRCVGENSIVIGMLPASLGGGSFPVSFSFQCFWLCISGKNGETVSLDGPSTWLAMPSVHAAKTVHAVHGAHVVVRVGIGKGYRGIVALGHTRQELLVEP